MSLQREKPGSLTLHPRRSLDREHREILAECMFRKILRWERKRAERSHEFFLLMLIDASRVFQTKEVERVLSETLSTISCSTRETDIVGWYQESAVLGVIFTEIHKADRTALQTLMRDDVIASLRARLGAEQADQIHISFHFFPEDKLNFSRLADAELYPDLHERDDTRKFCLFVKRAMDILGSVLALVLCSPLFIIISLAIKLTSKGPILFRQERVGQNGVRFTFLKFRSMKFVSDPGIHRDYVKRFIAGEIGPAQSGDNRNVVYKIQNDPRVTRVGKFLRKTSLDELPQFINVLKGEMSLVGPRPPIPYEIELYQAWHLGRVAEVKPGITGLWQVNGRSKSTFDEMVRLDLRYARMWSPWMDIKILLRTPRAVFFGEGAY